MKVNIIHDEQDLRFFAKLGEHEAELTYTYPGETEMDFDHTFVPEEYRNQEIADQLVQTGLDFARSKNYKVIPSCPVVEAYVRRHPDYKDLLI
jgi:uncharacterized protein